MAFVKGKSGNAKGRPVGQRNSAVLMREAIEKCGMDEGEYLQHLIMRSLDVNDPSSATITKLILDRLVAPLKSAQMPIQINNYSKNSDLLQQVDTVIDNVVDGTISTEDAQKMGSLLSLKQDTAALEELQAINEKNGIKHKISS